jgi:hypothetical protein
MLQKHPKPALQKTKNATDENKATSETFIMEDFVLQIGSKDITVSQEALSLNAPVVKIDEQSYLPLRFFLDWLSAEKVTYDRNTETITFSLKRPDSLDPAVKNKYQRKEPYEVVKEAPIKEIKYKIESSNIDSPFAKRMQYIVLFEDDEVTIKEVETTLRKVADEKIKTDNPDALVVNAMLESQNKKGNSTTWASLKWAPGGKWENASKNTPKSENSFTFEDWSETYEQIKKLYK